ncbi:MAG: OmpA family protein [bacterium]|nr:OmpA family protein [bacterium]
MIERSTIWLTAVENRWRRWQPWGFLILLAVSPVAEAQEQAVPDQEPVSYEELVEYLRQPSTGMRAFGGVAAPADPLRITVTFDFDRADLTPLGRRQLDLLADALKEVGDRRIELAGHCDERGSERYNLRLSERRVTSAVYYLSATHQIAHGRVVGLGYGESQPKIPKARTEPEHAANRRVEIRLLGGHAPSRDQAPVASPANRRAIEPQVVDNGATRRIAIEWGVFRTNSGQMRLIAHDGTARLRSGDEYRIYVRPDIVTYVYIYQIDSNGEGAWLFPRDDSLGSNPLPTSDFWIPAPDRSFRLAPLTGERRIDENIHLVASAEPIAELERLLAIPDAAPADVIRELGSRGQRIVPRRPAEEAVTEALARIEGTDDSGRLRHVIRFGHEAP